MDRIINQIIEISNRELAYINMTGHAHNGNNGPYKFNDTPVRNSAHWCCTLEFLYRSTGNEKYLNSLKILGQYLLNEEAKTKSGAIECMDGKKFDHINGLMGQAWSIEGFIALYRATQESQYLMAAIKLFKTQMYRYDASRWDRIEIDGSNIGDDPTFNHQLWFAAAGVQILEYYDDVNIKKCVFDFLENIDKNFSVYNDGLIKHYGPQKNMQGRGFKDGIRRMIPHNLACSISPDRFYYRSYENAYHLFNMYAFALIYEKYPELPFFHSNRFKLALKYSKNINYLNKQFNVSKYIDMIAASDLLKRKKISRFAYAYNSPAFEYGYVNFVFFNDSSKDVVGKLWDIQCNLCFSEDTKLFDRNTDDAYTLTARIYELCRYIDEVNLYECSK